MPMHERSRNRKVDLNALAKSIVDEATGERKPVESGKDRLAALARAVRRPEGRERTGSKADSRGTIRDGQDRR